MGKSFHVVSPLESPLREVDDRVMFIPAASELVVDGGAPRLLLVCDGRARVHVDAQFLGEIGPGDIIIIPGPARVVYRSVQGGRESRLHVFRVVLDARAFACDPNTGWLAPLGARHEETNFVIFLQNRLACLRHLARGGSPAIHALLEAVRRDAEAAGPGYRHRVSARIRLLLTLVAEQLEGLGAGVPVRVQPPRHRWISEQVKEYLLTHATQPLTLENIARHLRLSGEHLARVFRREEGRTIFDFLREVRIDRAKELLIAAQLSVREIAQEVGYSSATLFNRNFKRSTGVTPLVYRKRGGGRHSFSASVVRATHGR